MSVNAHQFRRPRRRPGWSVLHFERLEPRRVLDGSVSGLVFNDVNGDAALDDGEPGMASVVVYADANDNGQLDRVGSSIEPDDFAVGQNIRRAVSDVTLTIVDDSNNENPMFQVLSNEDPRAATGRQVFGSKDGNFFDEAFRLRADFAQPVRHVSLHFTATEQAVLTGATGVLQAFNSQGVEIDRFETAPVPRGNSATMTLVRQTADVAYIVAFTKLGSALNSGLLDSLRFDAAGSEPWTISGADGEYVLLDVPAGTQHIRQTVPAGWVQTFPGNNASHEVTVVDNQQTPDIRFGNLATNPPPTAGDDSVTLAEDTSAKIDVLANDSDDAGLDRSTVTIRRVPANGTASVDPATGEIRYTPNTNYFGSDSLAYTVRDLSGLVSNEATVSITVESVNDAPTAVDDAGSTAVNQPVTLNVVANDSDVDGTINPSSLAVASAPQFGTATANADGTIVYTPANDFAGTDTFRYTVRDDLGAASNEAIVTVEVRAARSWQNPNNPLDVDNSGQVIPLDVLLIINELNQPVYGDPVTGQLPPPPDPVPFFFDVNGDGFVAPIDALLVINFLNTNPPAAAAASTSGGQLRVLASALPEGEGDSLAEASRPQAISQLPADQAALDPAAVRTVFSLGADVAAYFDASRRK